MTNRLELNWELDGFVDEQRYYCSETPIDPLNLPVPKAVLAGDVRTYTDTVIDTGKTYFVCVGSVKNGVEKLSSILVTESTIYRINANFINSVLENGTLEVSWVNNGGIILDENGANINAHNKFMQCSTAIDFNANFKITFEILFKSFTRPAGVNAVDGAFEIISNANSPQNNSSRFFSISAISDGNNWGGIDRSLYFGVSNVWAIDSTKALNVNQFYKVELEKIGSTITLKVDDELIGTKTSAPAVTNTNAIRVGSTQRSSGGYGNFVIKNFKVK